MVPLHCTVAVLAALSIFLSTTIGASLEPEQDSGHLYGVSPADGEQDIENSDRTKTSAKERFFTLVKFHPEVCVISPTMVGTCTTSTDCTNRGGSNIGSCARGFGVCCLLILTATTQNPYVIVRDKAVILEGGAGVTMGSYEFPRLEGSCQLMVEFLEFTLAAPVPATGLCTEAMRISGSVTVNSGFTICGPMINQRIFLSYGRGERITLEFNTPNTGRYRIRVRHVQCTDTALLAPPHCLQHFTTSTGVVRSFSYGNSMTTAQRYTVCIQEQSISDHIEWLECVEGTDTGALTGLRSQFLLSNYFLPTVMPPAPMPPFTLGVTGFACDLTSFVEVFGEHKHCGAKFTINNMAGQMPVTSRAKPYQLFVSTTPNAYQHLTVPTDPYQMAFPYPPPTAVPPPRPLCAEYLAGPTAGPQGFLPCMFDVMKVICWCPLAPVLAAIDAAVPPRTGFCLKYALM